MSSFDWDALKDRLVCPKSRARLVHDGDSLVSTDPDCRLRYQIQDGIPIMLIEDATELSREEWEAVMQRAGQEIPN